ncbi:GAF domain-containing protein [Aeromicrobium sp. CF4.19]|uniref:GAF domain-containing protein n=1 Tax=Aeromicrobium sp. CF4.19 TaxID=3373082 RepID=UPI003EE54A7A
MDETTVLRAPMRSRRDEVDVAATVARALALGLVGMGRASDAQAERRLERYAQAADGSFAWTQSEQGFHLGRITGALRTDDSPEAVRVDLVHVRPCTWVADAVDPVLVPEQVTYAFSRGGRNLQTIGLAGALEATRDTWHRLA